VVEIIENFLRRLKSRLVDDFFFQVFPGDVLHQLDAESGMGADALICCSSSAEAESTPRSVLNFLRASFACGLQSLRGVPRLSSSSTTS